MPSSYIIRFFDAEGGTIQSVMMQSEDQSDALRSAVNTADSDYAKLEISIGNCVVWAGERTEAETAAAKVLGPKR